MPTNTLHYNLKKYNAITDFLIVMDTYINDIADNFQTIDDELNRVENQSNFLKTGWDEFQTFPTLTFDDITRTLTIEGNGATYWLNNVLHSIDSDIEIQIDPIEGVHFIYFDNGGIQTSTTAWPFNYSICPICVVYWDNVNIRHIGIGYEFHKWIMQPLLHGYLHNTIGTAYYEGLDLTEISSTLVRLSTGTIYDEDIKLDIGTTIGANQVLNPLTVPIIYREGANGNIRVITSSTDLCYLNPSPQINVFSGGVWQWEATGNNKYFVYWLLATNDTEIPIILVPGQVSGITENEADEQNTLSGMQFGALKFAEYVVLSRIMMVSSPTSYSIVGIDDYRTSKVTSSTTPQLEIESSIIDILPNIATRDGLVNVTSGKQVHVVDASGDFDIYSGWAQYIYDGAQWIRTNESNENTSFGIFYQMDNNSYLMETIGIDTFSSNKVALTITIDAVAGGLSVDGLNGRIVHSGKTTRYNFNATATVRDPSVPNMAIRFVLVKNGLVQISPSLSYGRVESAGGAMSLDAASGVLMEDGDYIEVYCKTDKLNGSFWVDNMQLQLTEVPQ